MEFEIFSDGDWHLAANAQIHEPDRGFESPATLDYDLAYFVERASIDYANDEDVHDNRALSVGFPVNMATYNTKRWPPFLLDLMPQGHARRKLAEALKLPPDERATDLPLLLHTGGNTIGNIRVRGAGEKEREEYAEGAQIGVTEAEILDKSDRFIEVFDRFAMIASGSSGIQGEWPKVAMTLAEDGLYYPDSLVEDDRAKRHVIVKLARSTNEKDHAILRLEGMYSSIALQLGLHVHEENSFAPGVLIIPRFDRLVLPGGGVSRHGQESLVSAAGVAEFSHVGTHEAYIDVIKRYSTEPRSDIAEYVCRDIANLAMGNTDNHGRNTALSKYADGTIRLSPLFDFAPMRLADEVIPRSTKWACMKPFNRDTSPDWKVVCETIYPDDENEAVALHEALQGFAERLQIVPQMLAEVEDIAHHVQRATARLNEVRAGVLDTGRAFVSENR